MWEDGVWIWSEEELREVWRLYKSGKSYKEIQEEIGCTTRNQIAGKITLLRKEAGEATSLLRPRSKPLGRPRKSLATPAKPKKQPPQVAAQPIPKPKPKPEPAPVAILLPKLVPVVDVLDYLDKLGKKGCRWIEGDFAAGTAQACLNKRRSGKSYCLAHLRVTVKPLKRRDQQRYENAHAEPVDSAAVGERLLRAET